MHKQTNVRKFIDTEATYSPRYIGDIIFPNDEVRNVVTAYASGEVRRPLILCGRNGTGKSLIARLIPKAIEKMDAVSVSHIKSHWLDSNNDVDTLLSNGKMFDKLFTVNGQRYSYYVIE